MGREEEIEYAREHGIPVKGGTEIAPYSIDDNLWGRSSEGRWIEDLDARARRRRLPARDAARAGARRAAGSCRSASSAACRSRSTASGSGSSSCSSASPSSAAATASGSSTTSRTGSSASRSATSTRCRRRRSSCPRTRSSRSSSARSTRTSSSRGLDRQWAYLVYAGLWWEPLRGDLDAYMERVNEQVTRHDRRQALQGLGARRDADVAERRLRPGAGVVRGVRRAVLPAGVAGLHRAVVAAVADGPPAARARRRRGRGRPFSRIGGPRSRARPALAALRARPSAGAGAAGARCLAAAGGMTWAVTG